MKISEITNMTFKALRQRLADQTQRRPMVVPTEDSDFCHTAVEREWLTKEQMTHAATHYPRTDPVGDHYLAWLELADQARRMYDISVGVNTLLEDKATPEQKEQCIDLVEFLF